MNWKCRQCQASLEISDGATMKFCPQCGAKAEMSSVPADSSQKSAQTESNICPVCCAPIQPGDDRIVCPDCKMAYHKDCWNDNNGCATYGCSSAGCLNPAPLKVELDGGKSGETVCPHCGVSLAAGATFCWSCGNELSATAALPLDAPLAGAWSRWGARVLDYVLEMLAIGFVIGTILDLDNVKVIAGIILAPFVFLLDSAVYAIFKNTLGKWLFGIRIIELSGMPVNAERYFYRNLRVYWGGYGLGIPIVFLCTFSTQYNRVSNGDPATYDEILHLKSVRGNANGLKTFVGVVLLIILYILLILDYLHLH